MRMLTSALLLALAPSLADAHKLSCPSRDMEVWENPTHGSIRFLDGGRAVWVQEGQSTEYRIEPDAAAPPAQVALEDGTPEAAPIRFSKSLFQWQGDILLLIWDGINFHLECRKPP